MTTIGKVLVLGARGTLGGQFMRLYPEATGWDREDVNVLDAGALLSRLDGLGFVPDAVVNCVAFNDVDGAEDRPEQAFALNAEFPGRLALWTRQKNIPLVHYSTNYVFDGARGEYREADAPAPLSAYGRSKWRGEQLVAENGGRWYVLRTAVIFGPKGESDLSKKSFVDIMLDLAAKRNTIEAVADEINSLTYAVDLAARTRDLLEAAPPAGIYHVTNGGGASWYDFAREIFRIAGKTTTVLPVPSTRFPRQAKRPARAVLLNTLLPPLRPWQEALADFLGSATAEMEPPAGIEPATY
jgi:dTDP-4-dehydrorhamnose reductase